MDKKIVLATNNKNKVSELRSMLSNEISSSVEVFSLDDIGYTDEIEETGSTFEENALIKAETIAALGYIAIADDSGLTVDALDGAPGVYSARYSGVHGHTEANNAKLLRELDGLPYEKRGAHFVSSVVCVFPDNREKIVVQGSCDGVILTSPRGSKGFGYDPLFYYEPYKKSFAELTGEEKNAVSHRGIAMKKLLAELKKSLVL